MKQFKYIVEKLKLNSVRANIGRSQKLKAQGLEDLRERGRTTENKAAQFTRSFDRFTSLEQTQSSSKL